MLAIGPRHAPSCSFVGQYDSSGLYQDGNASSVWSLKLNILSLTSSLMDQSFWEVTIAAVRRLRPWWVHRDILSPWARCLWFTIRSDILRRKTYSQDGCCTLQETNFSFQGEYTVQNMNRINKNTQSHKKGRMLQNILYPQWAPAPKSKVLSGQNMVTIAPRSEETLLMEICPTNRNSYAYSVLF